MNDNLIIIKKNVISAFAIKGLSLLISLMTMPAFIAYFGDQTVLGIWYTLLSILNWVLSFDLGMGNGLRNHLTVSLARHDWETSKDLVSSAYFSNGLLSLLFVTVGLFVLPMLDWNTALGISSDILSHGTLLSAIVIVYIAIVLQLFLRLANFMAYALQRSYVNNLLALITNASLLLAVVILPANGPSGSRLLSLAFAYLIASNTPLLITTILLFCGPMKKARPSWSHVEKKAIRKVTALGGAFFAAQIEYMVLINTNEFFISHFVGPSAVVTYQAYYKIFSLVGTVVTLSITPVWSVVTKALAERDYGWVASLYMRLKKFGMLGGLLSFLLAPALPVVFQIWLQSDAPAVSLFSSVSFALFGAVFAYQSILSTFACGMGKMMPQIACYGLGCAAKLMFLPSLLALTGDWTYAVLITAIVLCMYCLIQQLYLNKSLRALSDRR